MKVILDAYTDEPSGLGVPPYLGTYPRYLFGALREKYPDEKLVYLTIDDARAALFYRKIPSKDRETRTNTKIYNLTRPVEESRMILRHAEAIIVSGGIQTPGKYLSAVPGTFYEMKKILSTLKARKILAGPAAAVGTRLEGGKRQEKLPLGLFDRVERNFLGIENYRNVGRLSVRGAEILEQIPFPVMLELESGRGCPMRCSFCTEPLKYPVEDRPPEEIIEEAEALHKYGARRFRFGKATCFFAYGKQDPDRMEYLLSSVAKLKPDCLHIDNANPNNVTDELTRIIVKHCTPGNTAAFGVESFDMDVVRKNTLNTTPERALAAVEIINRYGRKRGNNGMPIFLPGINILFGLIGETKKTHEENLKYLREILDRGLLLRRINIRQVVPFDGTRLAREAGTKFVRKNKSHYWKWRNQIRQEIDLPMLRKIVPEGTILRNVRMEVYDGNTTFGRQWGTYPLIVGVKDRLEIGSYYDVKVEAHMLRSITASVVRKSSVREAP